jgi:hypothetical protein
VPGLSGQDGADGVTDLEVVQASQVATRGSITTIEAFCPTGKGVLGGGYWNGGGVLTPSQGIYVLRNSPSSLSAGSWVVQVFNPDTGSDGTVNAYAVCTSIS